ncbi:hypothetical protein J1N35_015997 [Gossypium stocksii]|uniref:Uncharacterized protein n=1 Tax=Gossypium stocksii TaxID=47602 RepID=A0A9D3VZG5_9ROSI|nr:hypothetical protein J1N35_015997 [Gossypium stocksii]
MDCLVRYFIIRHYPSTYPSCHFPSPITALPSLSLCYKPIFCLHCCTVFDYSGEADELEGGELVPPHVILERRVAGKMAFSVCSGNGRTLKGRDLCQVRNSVLRMTEFLEA